MKPAAGEAKKTTAAADVLGRPEAAQRGARDLFLTESWVPLHPLSGRSVSTVPGPTALTVMPCGASSSAKDRVRLTTAPFEAL